MSNHQKHRGQHSNDQRLFSDTWMPVLNEAVADLSWMLSKGYPDTASLKLVGDRYRLDSRQRAALLRASCTDSARQRRIDTLADSMALKGCRMAIDGYNLLITIESALAGGVIVCCRDGCYRDIASIHGTYRRVEETLPALVTIGVTLQRLEVAEVTWLLDSPVANSGRLRWHMLEIAAQYQFAWEVELTTSPDKRIVAAPDRIAVSSDSWVLDHHPRWYNLHRHIADAVPNAWIIPLTGVYDEAAEVKGLRQV
ncbi:MAG: DUF434 domain-containing protein [Bacteroidia bacterium]|nr:DUF434 domain-containing protein [Bacteroidia bacterium]